MKNDPLLKPAERDGLLRDVRFIHSCVSEVVATIPDSAWTARKEPGSWSPSEVVEHMLLVESGIVKNVRGHLHELPTSDWADQIAGKEAVLRGMLPRAGRARASEKNSTFRGHVRRNVNDELASTRKEFEALLSETEELPLKALVWQHPMFGLLNGYLWLLYIPLHSERHLLQLRLAAQSRS